MKISHFRDVVAVARSGSLRGASRQLQVAQPAITRSIRELEQEVGAVLFERHARGVKLTNLGSAFLQRAEAILEEIRRATDELAQMKGEGQGQVSVALSTATCMSLMPQAINLFYRRYPDALVKVSESLFQPIETDVLNGRFDLYVGPLDPATNNQQLSIEWLFKNERMVVARKGHALAGARSLQELSEARWVRPTLSDRTTDIDLEKVFVALGLPAPKVAMHARSALVTLLAVTSSDLLSMLPRQWLELPDFAKGITVLDIAEPMAPPPMCIVRRHDMPLTPMAEYLQDMFRRAAQHFAERHGLPWPYVP